MFTRYLNEKKYYFKLKTRNTLCKIWDMEFLTLQLKNTREGFRLEYDRLNEQIQGVKTRLSYNTEHPEGREDESAALTTKLAGMEHDATQLKAQMDGLDAETEKTRQNIDGHREVYQMLREYTKTV